MEAQIIKYAEPDEIHTEVQIETDSKMQQKPSAKVKIVRHLENIDKIDELIKADLSRGVTEASIAINEVLKKAGMGK